MKAINVLLIEDHADQAQLVSAFLARSESADYALTVRTTLEAGLERVSEEAPDLVLLDLDLPDSRGADTFAAVYAAAPSVPIVILTGGEDEELALSLVKRGAQDYLIKARLDRHTLTRAARHAIERKATQEELRKTRDELELRVMERTAALGAANASLEREVAERRRAETALRESNRLLGESLRRLRDTQEAVVQRERLHALGLMARGVAHNFSNALSPIIGFSDLLLTHPEMLGDPGQAGEYLRGIHTAASASADLVAALNNFHRARAGEEKIEEVDLAEVVQNAVRVTEYRWKDQALGDGIALEIKTRIEAGALTVEGSASELLEALTNLIINAADAMTGDGAIEIELREELGLALLTIRDGGAGMAEEVRMHCMEPFFSTKGADGSGLGLGAVYGIVSRHGGSIEIESAEQRGTTVTLTFPKFQPHQMATPEVEETQEAVTRANILVVDDEMLVREVLQVYLEGDGHRVTMAEDGQEALEIFKAGKFDVVLTDRAMPEMNGDQLALAIKEVSAETPVVLLTGYGDTMSDEGESMPGVDFILGKPFSMDSLRTALGKALRTG